MTTNRLDRRTTVATLLANRKDALVVTGLGSATYDVAASGDTPRNFYLWGAMGGTAALALGLACAQPEMSVIAVTGDGEMLMGMGSFSTIALQQPKNLTLLILDNGLYGETGAQQSHTARTDLAAVAKAAGIETVEVVETQSDLERVKGGFPAATNGPRVIVVKIAPAEYPRLVPLREGAHAKVRMREALGLSAE